MVPERRGIESPARRVRGEASAFDQSDFSGARAFAGFLGRELHALTFPQQLEHGATDRTAVEEVLDAAFIPDETESLIDEQTSDRSRWHTQVLR